MTSIVAATKALEAWIAKARGGAGEQHIVFDVAENEDPTERITKALVEMGIDPEHANVIQVEHLRPLARKAASPPAELDDASPVARPAPAPKRAPPASLARLAADRRHGIGLDDDECQRDHAVAVDARTARAVRVQWTAAGGRVNAPQPDMPDDQGGLTSPVEHRDQPAGAQET